MVKPEPTTLERIPAIPLDPQERIKVIHDGRVRYEELPESVKEVYDSARKDYRLMVSLHEKLKLAETDEDRKRIYTRLCITDDTHRSRWAIIDKWAKSGELPEGGKVTGDGFPDYKEVNAARLAISRYLKQLDTENDPDKVMQLKAKAVEKVGIIQTAGGKFDRLQPKLKHHGIL